MVARRVWALSGVAFVIIALGGVVVFGGDTPDTNASAAKVVSYYSEHTTRQSIAAFVLAATRLAFCGGFDLEDPEILAEAAAAAGIVLDDYLQASRDSGSRPR